MKNYLNSFIVGYEVYDDKIIIDLENNKNIIIPYTKEDEINILKNIKKQIKEKDEINIKLMSSKISLFLVLITFIPLLLACLITFGIGSLTLIVTCFSILSTLIEINEVKTYKSRLKELNRLNNKYVYVEIKDNIKNNDIIQEYYKNEYIIDTQNIEITPKLIKKMKK